jgi:hypothetical protein
MAVLNSRDRAERWQQVLRAALEKMATLHLSSELDESCTTQTIGTFTYTNCY